MGTAWPWRARFRPGTRVRLVAVDERAVDVEQEPAHARRLAGSARTCYSRRRDGIRGRGPALVMRRSLATALLASAMSVVVALLAGELLVRALATSDVNGQTFFRGRRLRPYQLPVASLTERLATLRASADSYLMYDPHLGWTIRPDGRSQDGRQHANAAGLRADREYTATPAPDVLRIAIFGDSFTHGDEVLLDETWGRQLEGDLARRGIRAEVLNFGVGGYGMDQALLRWRALGRRWMPQLVVLGFVVEDVYRNVNVLRSLYYPATDLPFSKPRFVLAGDELRVINDPALPPEMLPATLARFADTPLASHEFFFRPRDYVPAWWRRSRLASLVDEIVDPDPIEQVPNAARFLAVDGEPARVTIAILRAFRREVEATGAAFRLLDLPRRADLETLAAGRPLAHQPLLDRLHAEQRTVETRAMLLARRRPALFAPGGHYAAPGCRAIAHLLARTIVRERRTR
jgi:hypothetical protein